MGASEADGALKRGGDHFELRVSGVRGFAEDPEDRFRLRSGDRGAAGLDDAGLFCRDGFKGIAQPLLVVESDGRQHADLRTHHVGGIQASPHACFKYRNIDLLFGEMRQG